MSCLSCIPGHAAPWQQSMSTQPFSCPHLCTRLSETGSYVSWPSLSHCTLCTQITTNLSLPVYVSVSDRVALEVVEVQPNQANSTEDIKPQTPHLWTRLSDTGS